MSKNVASSVQTQSQAPVLERKFHVNGLTIAGQHWGIGNSNPVIAIHGWMDNSASFNAIAPLLAKQDAEVIALDLAGHGESGHRCQHGSYNIWDDLLDIVAVAEQLNWSSFTLLAHSRGAFVGVLLATAMPELINKLVMLDGIITIPSKAEEAPKQLGDYLKDQKNLYQRPSRVYASIDEAVNKRIEKISLSAAECKPLVERALMRKIGREIGRETDSSDASKEAWVWRHDQRISGSSAFRLTDQHQQAFLSALKTPALLIMAEQGLFKWQEVQQKLTSYPDINLITHPGGHHMHMQSDHCDSIANYINEFTAA